MTDLPSLLAALEAAPAGSRELDASPMPCISLWQPYASLIACGAKPFETRHWAAPARFIGQRVAIHAAARKPTRYEVDGFDEVEVALSGPGWHLRIPYGVVVCTALLIGQSVVRDRDGSCPVLADGRTIEDDGFGDYDIGRWCWELREVEAFDPVPAKGSQGWWTWTPPATLRARAAGREGG